MIGEVEMNPIIGGEKIEVVHIKANPKNLMVAGDELVQILITMIDGLQDDQHLGMMKMKDGIVVNQDGLITIPLPMNGENLIGEKLCQNGTSFFDLININYNLFSCTFIHFRAVDNPGEKGGSFDSSGAFHDNHYDEHHYNNMRDEQSREV